MRRAAECGVVSLMLVHRMIVVGDEEADVRDAFVMRLHLTRV